MRIAVRPAMRSLTHSAIRIASAIETGIVPAAKMRLFQSERQNTGSAAMVA